MTGFVGVDVLFGRGLVLAQVSQFVEGVTEGARGDDHHAQVTQRHGFGHDLATVAKSRLSAV